MPKLLLLDRRRWSAGALALAACCGGATVASAQDAWVSPKERPSEVEMGDRAFEPQGRLHIGPIKVHPTLRQTFTYDDNIFLEDRSPEDDIVSVTSIGTRLDLTPGNWEITVGGRMKWNQYLGESKESHADIVGDFHINYIGRVLRVELADTIAAVEDPLNLVTTEALERVTNTARIALRAEMARFGWDLEFRDVNMDFRKPFGASDHSHDTASLTLRMLVASERTLFAQYTFGRVDYWRSFRDDWITNELMVGVRGRISAKLEGEAAIGWLIQTVQEASGNPDAREHSGPVGRAQIAWSPSPRLAFTARYRTNVQFAQFANYQVVDRGELVFEWRPDRVVARLFGYVENNDPIGSPPFLNSGIGATVDWDVAPWLSIGVGTSYRWRATDIPNAEYENFRAWIHLSAYL